MRKFFADYKLNYPAIILLAFVFLELIMQTKWLGRFGAYKSPTLWMLGALGTCAVAFYMVGFKNLVIEPAFDKSRKVVNRLLLLIVFGLGSVFIAKELAKVFAEFAVDQHLSDIIPSLELYVKRFLGGEKVYAPLVFDGWTVLPTYFPMLWMPYCFSEILNIDYRWTAYVVFLLAICMYFWKLAKQELTLLELILKSAFPFYVLYVFVTLTKQNFGMAVELMPAGLYLMLALSILNRSYWVMGIGIFLCLMSRYAFTFWLPVYLLIIWFERGFATGFKTGLIALLGVVLIYIIPFFAKEPTILTDGLKYYETTAITQWVPQYWQEPGAKPYHLDRGLSFAIVFYDKVKGDSKARLSVNRKVHLILCAITALLILFGYFMFRNKGLNVPIYLLIGLKFYLTIFYGFFYVPFSYLYQLPFLLTIPILYYVPLFLKKNKIGGLG